MINELEEPGQPEEEKFGPCPTCNNLRRMSTIIEDKCDSCRAIDKPAAIVATLGWPEVRQRRMVLLVNSDATQLPDRDPEMSKRFQDWRQKLRDVTQLPDPFTAWYALDELESGRPSE